MPPPETTAEAPTSACADDGPVFPITGKCVGRAINFIENPAMPDDYDIEFFNQMTDRDDCHWELMEMPFATDALFYQGMVCGDNKSTLDFAGGAQASEIILASSAYGDVGGLDYPLVTVYGVNPDDVFSNILFRAREQMEDKTAAEACDVVQAGIPGWPQGALVVDNPAEADAHDPNDGPRSACGPYGLNQDSENFWLIFGGFSWFFQMGQEPVGIAPESFTLMTQDADGEWTVAN